MDSLQLNLHFAKVIDFTGLNTLHSASIASDRGGNKRAVLVSKRSEVIKRGFKSGMDVKQFQDTWLTSGFQSNFM